MLLRTYLSQYLRAHETGVAPSTASHLYWAIRSLERWAAGPVDLGELHDDGLNAWIDWLRERRKPDTARTYRGAVLTLWRAAWMDELVDQPPRRIRKLKRGRRSPEAWTYAEVAALVGAAPRIRGRFRNTRILIGEHLETLVRCAWDTALRRGDLLALDRDQIPPAGGVMRVVQHKTGDEVICYVQPLTAEKILRFSFGRQRIWPLWSRRQFRKLVVAAQIRRGSFKWLRRASVTAVEIQEEGAGTSHAGHRTRGVTLASYIDRVQIPFARPLPPALD